MPLPPTSSPSFQKHQSLNKPEIRRPKSEILKGEAQISDFGLRVRISFGLLSAFGFSFPSSSRCECGGGGVFLTYPALLLFLVILLESS